MTPPLTLRPMLPSDGPAIKELMENDPESPGMSITTRFLADPYDVWCTLKPRMIGAVVDAPDGESVIGVETMAFEDVQFNGRVLTAGFLENMKVHHAYRGQGIASSLSYWLIDVARERYGKDCVIVSVTSTQNTASLETMKKWRRQVSGPLTVLPRRILDNAPDPLAGVTVRAAEARDYAEIVDKANRFYADQNLYPLLSTDLLTEALAAGPYHYYVAESGGSLVAGMLLAERSQLMIDEFRNVPPPMRASPMFPTDGIMRLMEVSFAWFEQAAAAQYLWATVRWAFRERVTSLSAAFDPRGPLADMFPDEPGGMKLDLLVSVSGPEMMDDTRLVSNVLRG
jgi:GNAT superfamily N-acetyltransferase